MNHKRTQLTLFIPEKDAETIEKIRKEFNPLQYALIKSHVTLCRENELEQIEKVIRNLNNLNLEPVTIDFGAAVRFSNDKGVLIPCIDDNEPFQILRAKILQGITEKPEIQHPHITLMHPRNSSCTDETFAQIQKCQFPEKITFGKISLIEQEAGMKWQIITEFELQQS